MPLATAGTPEDAELLGSLFAVEINGVTTGYFTDASGLSFEMEVVEKIESSINQRTIKRPGTAKYGEITLKRSLSPDKSFWEWAKSIRDGKMDYRRDGAIVMYDYGDTEVSRWTFTNGWPSKWSASDLDVGSDDLMVEEITLAVESLERVK